MSAFSACWRFRLLTSTCKLGYSNCKPLYIPRRTICEHMAQDWIFCFLSLHFPLHFYAISTSLTWIRSFTMALAFVYRCTSKMMRFNLRFVEFAPCVRNFIPFLSLLFAIYIFIYMRFRNYSFGQQDIQTQTCKCVWLGYSALGTAICVLLLIDHKAHN